MQLPDFSETYHPDPAILALAGWLGDPVTAADFPETRLRWRNDRAAASIGRMARDLGLTGWVSLCQVVRAETLRLRETAYVQAAKVLGYRSLRIIVRHVLPNLFHLVIIYFTMRFAFAIMTEVIGAPTPV